MPGSVVHGSKGKSWSFGLEVYPSLALKVVRLVSAEIPRACVKKQKRKLHGNWQERDFWRSGTIDWTAGREGNTFHVSERFPALHANALVTWSWAEHEKGWSRFVGCWKCGKGPCDAGPRAAALTGPDLAFCIAARPVIALLGCLDGLGIGPENGPWAQQQKQKKCDNNLKTWHDDDKSQIQ